MLCSGEYSTDAVIRAKDLVGECWAGGTVFSDNWQWQCNRGIAQVGISALGNVGRAGNGWSLLIDDSYGERALP